MCQIFQILKSFYLLLIKSNKSLDFTSFRLYDYLQGKCMNEGQLNENFLNNVHYLSKK